MSSSEVWKNFDKIRPVRGLIIFFKVIGVWPLDIKNRFLYYLYIVYGCLFQFTFSYAYAVFGSTVVSMDVKMVTEQIFDGLAEIAMCLRMTNFLYHFKDATYFLTTIKSFELRNHEEYELYKKRLSLFSKLMRLFIVLTSFAVTFSNTAPLFSSYLRLPYPGWYPLDWKNDRTNYWIVYFYQLIGGAFLAHTLIILQYYQIYCMICATAQIEILGTRLEKIGTVDGNRMLVNHANDSNCERYLLECLDQHKFVMKFVSDIERVFNMPFMFQLFCTTAIFCVTGFRIILMEDDTVTLAYYVTFFCIFLNEIFMPCYFGTLLTEANDRLAGALFSSNWTGLSRSFKKAMMMFLEYTKRPKIMLSGKIFPISLPTFLTVINRSYSMFAVLRNLIK